MFKLIQPRGELAAGRLVNTALMVLGSNLFLGIAIIAGAIGLIRFGCHVIRLDEATKSAMPPSGAIDCFEVLQIWMPEALMEIAKGKDRLEITQSHQKLRRFLERRHEEKLWYAFTTRAHFESGDSMDYTYLHYPYEQPLYFPEFVVVLGRVAGDPPGFDGEPFSRATITVVTREL